MLALIALAAAVSGQQASAAQPTPSVQALATVRIISGVRLNLAGHDNGSDIPVARRTMIQANGVSQPARLIEFQ